MPRGEPTRSVPVRLTDRQRELADAAAQRAGEPLTVFMRRVVLEASGATPAPTVVRQTVAVDGREVHRRVVAAVRRERPAHSPTCRCGVCRPPKPAKS